MPEKDAAAQEATPAAEANAEGTAKKEEAAAPPPAAAAAPAPKPQMKSVVLAGFGGMKMIKVQQKPQPSAAEGEVLIRVKVW